MNEKEQFMDMLRNQELKKADAIVLLAGDLYHRIPKVVQLFSEGYAPYVVLTSNADDPAYGSLPAHKLVSELVKSGIPDKNIFWEETAAHTRAEADSTLRIAKEKGWTSLILVTTEFHQYRAFLSWIQALRDAGVDISLRVSPISELASFHNESREVALAREDERILKYQEKGDVAKYQDGIDYLNKT